ncbi:sensor histidine kinase [Oligoflexus tunisiensis]|uniref:sensor histidine kinase n=1 Tax=Oligoflexus tunisiensis TaxID=708132 RepID=UPI00114C8A98|nr:GAF domain-containing sensor histidine kinase [Oligoflexus tunisiensis]
MSLKKEKPKTEEYERKFQFLLESAKAMAEIRDLDRLLDFLAKQSIKAIRADRCSIFLLDTDGKSLWSKVALGVQMIKFPKDTGIAGYTVTTGNAIIMDDPYSDIRFNRDIDKQTGYLTQSILSVPMFTSDERIIGSFELINKKDGKFTEQDLDYLQAFANQAALAIEMSLLYGQQKRIIEDLKNTQKRLELKIQDIEFVYRLEQASSQAMSIDDYLGKCFDIFHKFFNGQDLVFYLVENRDLALYHVFAEGEKIGQKTYNLHDLLQLTKARRQGNIKSIKNFANGLSFKELQALLKLKGERLANITFNLEIGKSGQTSFGCLEVISRERTVTPIEASLHEIISQQISSSVHQYKLLEERERANKFAEIGRLAAAIVHDFRSPFNTITILASRMASKSNQEGLSKEELARSCSVIERQTDRCSQMAEELLSFARGEKVHNLQDVQAKEFLQEAFDAFKVKAEASQIQCEMRVDYHGTLLIDREKMTRALLNLLNNALDALESGGKISLSCGLRDDGRVELRVSDTGPGVPIGLRDTLFDFLVTEGKEQGTGLGLYIAKNIVEAHGGVIYLDDQVNQGASFVICLSA